MQREAAWCEHCDKPLSSGESFLCERCRFWNDLAFPAISDLCREFDLDTPEGPADLRHWIEGDPARKAALEAAQAACINVRGRPCWATSGVVKVMTARQRVAVASKAYRGAGGQ